MGEIKRHMPIYEGNPAGTTMWLLKFRSRGTKTFR
jgi:glutaredoxin-related protein